MPFFSSPWGRKEERPAAAVGSPQRQELLQQQQQQRGRLGPIEAIDLEITVIRGAGLTPKDRALFGFGKLKSSDPYVKVYLVQDFPKDIPDTSGENSSSPRRFSFRRSLSFTKKFSNHSSSNRSLSTTDTTTRQIQKLKLGRTRTIYKTLHPQWNETIVGSLRGREALQYHTADHPAVLEFHIFDEDQLSGNDPMGTVRVALPVGKRNVDTTDWYEVPPESALNARGQLLIRIKTTLRRSHILVRGNTFELSKSFHSLGGDSNNSQQQHTASGTSTSSLLSRNPVIRLGLSWDVLKQQLAPAARTTPPRPSLSPTANGNPLPSPTNSPAEHQRHDSLVDGFLGGIPTPTANTTNTKTVDLDVSCVAISHEGHVIMPDTVYYGNLHNSNHSVLHSGDERTGHATGDDESITFHLAKIPSHVMAMYIIVSVATPKLSLSDVQSTRVTVKDITPLDHYSATPTSSSTTSTKQLFPQEHTLCEFSPSNSNGTAMFLMRLARDPSATTTLDGGKKVVVSKKWMLTPIEDTHPTARDFGSLIPHVKAYSRDICPSIHIDPTERVAILRKGGNIRVEDYCPNNTMPDRITFGLAWDVTDGEYIDLDASAICLDENLNLIDMVWWKQLHSKDYNIVHHGDEREGDELGDDEMIDLYLKNMTLMEEHCHVHYIGFVINSYSGQKLKDVARASCHLFDPETNIEMATYALTNAKALDGVTALLVGCLYRAQHGNPMDELQGMSSLPQSLLPKETDPSLAKDGEWCLSILSEASHGRTVKANVEEFQRYLKENPLPPAPTVHGKRAPPPVQAEMPPFVPLADETVDSLCLSPASSLATDSAIRPISPATTTSTTTTTPTIIKKPSRQQ